MNIDSTVNNCVTFAEALRLRPEADGIFVGRVSGFPVGLKFIDPLGAMVILIHVRHWLNAEEVCAKGLAYDPEIEALLTEKKLEIELDDRIAWLTFVDGVNCVANQIGVPLIESILQTFATAGLIGESELCHHCQKVRVQSVECIEGKAVQICRTCLEEKLDKKFSATPAGSAEAVPIFLISPFASLLGAALWTLVWATHTWFFELLNERVIYVPILLEVGVLLAIGFLVGGPVGWVIKQNQKRGGTVSIYAAFIFGVIAVLLGELFFLVWLIYYQFKIVSFSAAVHVLLDYYMSNDVIYLVTKLLAALVCVGVACSIAKPLKPKLNL